MSNLMSKFATAIIRKAFTSLRKRMWLKHRRHVSFGDLFTDRWDTASFYGFGEGSSCYDNVLIIGNVKVGKNTWIGPNCVLDGSKSITIGDNCSISAGVQIYNHHTVDWATSRGEADIPRAEVNIGSGVYIGPQSVIQMGVTIGDGAIIGACSFVNSDIPAGAKVFGVPAKIVSQEPTC